MWVTLYRSVVGKLPLPKFRVGDTVRVSKYKSTFSKGYEANFTEEIFKISKILRGDPNMYETEDHEGEPIIGNFYEFTSEGLIGMYSFFGLGSGSLLNT